MLIAAVDTATLTFSCALVEIDGGQVSLLAERREISPRIKRPAISGDRPRSPGGAPAPRPAGGHSSRLPGALFELLEMTEKTLSDVEGYAVGIGPGSFTGLRIGLATWKGLAYANRRPIVGASSLQALALEAAPLAAFGTLLVPLLDARKGELYAGFYRAKSAEEVEPQAPEAALSPAALLDRLAPLGPAMGFGEGYRAYGDSLVQRLPALEEAPDSPGAFYVARLAASRLEGAAFDLPALHALEPHYVRASEAEVKFPHGLGPGATRS